MSWLDGRHTEPCPAERHDNPADPEPDCTCDPPDWMRDR